jgi:non-specific serine/threonine protein kinase
MIGQTISHYKILEKLGGGGMGVVYKAEDTKLKRTVALKFLPPVFSFDQEAKKRFINEAQAASSLQHNNICNIHDIDETKDGQIFICMDCYEGETLKKKIERGQIKTVEAIDIIVQIAAGLQKAHEKGIIHRDIKPANIFITNDGVVKILDFGLAKLSGQTMMTKMGETVGTIAYMSPEQTRGELVDQRTDIWSLGVVLYEMITRNLPFKGDYDSAMIYSILNEEPKQLTEVPKEFQQIINKCLSKNPAERYQSIDELLDDLKKQKIIEGSGTTTRTIVRKKKSGKLIYLVIGVIVVAVLAITIWKSFPSGDSQSEKSKFIAVLPFHPITSSEEDKSFAEGIHDDILTQLAKIRDLKVIARTSVMQYQETKKPIKQIAEELGVGVILEGSTRRSGDMIRITAQLIDAETEEHLWADSYDRPYTDIFTIQSDVAQKIASVLQIKLAKEELASIETIPTENMEAWEYFQKAKYYWNNYFDLEGNLKSAQMFEKACELDTNFAVAYAWQARVYMTVYGYSSASNFQIDKETYLFKYEKAVERAIQLSPEIPEINMARASYSSTIKGDINSAINETKLANAKRPNDADILNSLAGLMSLQGDDVGALKLTKDAFELDPKNFLIAWQAAKSAENLGRYKEAEKWADIEIQNNPENAHGYADKLYIFLNVYGDLDRAENELNEAKKKVTMEKLQLDFIDRIIFIYKKHYKEAIKINETNPFWRAKIFNYAFLYWKLNDEDKAKIYFDSLRVECENVYKYQTERVDLGVKLSLAIAYAGLGDEEKALNQISKLDSSENVITAIDVVYFYELLGDNEKAIRVLEKTVSEQKGPLPGILKLHPKFDTIRSDPRFKKIITAAEERIRKSD